MSKSMFRALAVVSLMPLLQSCGGGSGSSGSGATIGTPAPVTPVNSAPVFTGPFDLEFVETTTGSPSFPDIQIQVSDPDGTGFALSIGSSQDEAFFTFDSIAEVLTINQALDFENPADADGDNVYVVEMTADDGEAVTTQTYRITILDETASFFVQNGVVAIVGPLRESFSGGQVSAAPDIDGDGVLDALIAVDTARVPTDDQRAAFLITSETILASDDGVIDTADLVGGEGLQFLISGKEGFSGTGVAGVPAATNADEDRVAISVTGPSTGLESSVFVVDQAELASRLSQDVLDVALVTLAADGDALEIALGPISFGAGTAQGALSEDLRAVGDVDGDGFTDLVACQPSGGSPLIDNSAGFTHIVFGDAIDQARMTSNVIALEDIAVDDNGVRIDGVDEFDYSCSSVAAAGDVDGDTLDDIIIGASDADPSGVVDAGAAYLIFGSAIQAARSGSNIIDLQTLVADDNGIQFNGSAVREFAGVSVSGVGDINDDTFDDFIIGAPGVGFQRVDVGNTRGRAYLVYGGPALGAVGRTVLLNDLVTDSLGSIVTGTETGQWLGIDVGASVDVDDDGVDDAIIVSRDAVDFTDAPTLGLGQPALNILFSSAVGTPVALTADTLVPASNGLQLVPTAALSDDTGLQVLGDIDGDGVDDLLVGLPREEFPDVRGDSGIVFVVSGQYLIDLSNGTGSENLKSAIPALNP